MIAHNITSVEYRASLNEAFDARVAFETAKGSKESMFAKLAKMRRDVDHDAIAQVMIAASVDAARINRKERENAAYNIYAYEKDINVARCIAQSDKLNHYTYHILKTAKALTEAGLSMTHDDAFCACRKSAKPSDASKAKLISRYDRIEVATGTASTQSSSSINALQSFAVLIETRDTKGKVAYKLNLDCEATQALLKHL